MLENSTINDSFAAGLTGELLGQNNAKICID
jgi:hypothetical protein